MKAETHCPKELLTRVRRHSLTPSERQRLDTHVVGCEDCDLELRMGVTFDRALADRAGDDVLASVMANAALRNWSPGGVHVHKPARAKRSIVWLTAAAMLVTMAALATVGYWFRATRATPDRSRTLGPLPIRAIAFVGEIPHRIESVAVVATRSTEIPVAPIPPRVSSRTASVAHHDSAAATESRAQQETAQELFLRANTSRHQGDSRNAAMLYRSLERQFPSAPESTLARVLLGRILLLDELHDAPGALAEFDSYLRVSPHGTLLEEALWGRARALDRMGRTDDSREAWRNLIDRFPNSIYSDRARQRISGGR